MNSDQNGNSMNEKDILEKMKSDPKNPKIEQDGFIEIAQIFMKMRFNECILDVI